MSDQTPGDAVPAVAWLAVIDTTATDIMVVVCSLVEVGDRVAGWRWVTGWQGFVYPVVGGVKAV